MHTIHKQWGIKTIVLIMDGLLTIAQRVIVTKYALSSVKCWLTQHWPSTCTIFTKSEYTYNFIVIIIIPDCYVNSNFNNYLLNVQFNTFYIIIQVFWMLTITSLFKGTILLLLLRSHINNDVTMM